MRRCAVAFEKTGGAQHQRARAHRGDVFGAPGLGTQKRQHLLVIDHVVGSEPAGHADDIELRAVGKCNRRHQGQHGIAGDRLDPLPDQMHLGARHRGKHLQWAGEIELGHLWENQKSNLKRCRHTSLQISLDADRLPWSPLVRNAIFPSFQDITMIGVLIFPDFQLLDAAGPISAFEIAARFVDNAPSIKVLAVTPGPVRSSSGVEMLARGLRPSGAITTLIIAGGEGVRAAATCVKTLAFVRMMAKRGIRIASVCSGAYVLAEAGLLDGRRAPTHWQRTRHFLKAYPQIKLEPDRIFVRDGNVWSSAGITAGIDLSLAMIAED